MSQWLDAAGSANKFRRSYVNGFLDVSGGVYVRADNSINLYDAVDDVTPKFSIQSMKMRVHDGISTRHDISLSKFIYLKDLTENVQDRITDISGAVDVLTSNYASKAYVDASINDAISALVDSSPEVLNTLNELATALGNDENFSTTVTTKIANTDL